MTKKFLFVLAFICLAQISVAQEPDFILFKQAELAWIKEVARDNLQIKNTLQALKKLADLYLKKQTVTITASPAPIPGLDPRTYYSESPYWWPDSTNPDGPFVRRDGLRYPGRFQEHKKSLIEMYNSVTTLSLAAYFFEDSSFARKARQQLKAWFVDPQTRMAPHLQYAQAVRNKSTGRPFGIIETHRFTRMLPALRLLAASGFWPAQEQQAVTQWFRQFLDWLTQSEFGQKEKMHGNNHSTWWSVQVMAIARFVKDDSLFEEVSHHVQDYLLEKQLIPPGRFPLEEKRTRSMDYAIFNLNAYAMAAQMLFVKKGVDFWHVKNSKGACLADAIQYLLPFLKQPEKWPLKQILPPRTNNVPFLFFYANQQQDSVLFKSFGQLWFSGKDHEQFLAHDPFYFLIDLLYYSKVN
ncbi:MAG TPA: hypothetical protein ENL21_04550 [Caldithrix abyssi]|uniref:Alginate lyase domain-containing protein n=1 Tax=Caldithrix abyssi TaxID=187145 RepID=A0A7V5LIG4_CALAY|nr:hypothetical protein [Caldithrix abyssi]